MSKNYARIEMDLAFGSAKPYGSSRSIVRRIASSLPLQPCPRVHFQLYPYTEDAGILFAPKRQSGLVASLADIGWIDQDEDDQNYFGGPRSGPSAGLLFRAHQPQHRLTRQRSLPSLNQGPPDPQGQTIANDVAIQKISALETELAKLRAQIAQIVLAQEKTSQPAAAATGAPPPPPPPCGSLPPPPPPPPLPSLQRTFSAIDLIKERKGKKTDSQTVLEPKPAEIPNMLDILKDIDKVKLRSVKNREGEADVKTKASEPADAAALIAEALKRKFAHRYRNNSEQEDKEDFKHPFSEENSKPAAPLFGQHMLKPTGKRKLL